MCCIYEMRKGEGDSGEESEREGYLYRRRGICIMHPRSHQ